MWPIYFVLLDQDEMTNICGESHTLFVYLQFSQMRIFDHFSYSETQIVNGTHVLSCRDEMMNLCRGPLKHHQSNLNLFTDNLDL